MPNEFKKLGISFQYPENWELDETEARQGQPSVSVYSPGGAFWTVSIHPRGTAPAKLTRAAVKAMRDEYEGLEHEAVTETISGHDLVGYDLSFFYLDLTSTASVRAVRTDQATFTVYSQAEDREMSQVRPVFLAMTTSLLNNLPRPRQPG